MLDEFSTELEKAVNNVDVLQDKLIDDESIDDLEYHVATIRRLEHKQRFVFLTDLLYQYSRSGGLSEWATSEYYGLTADIIWFYKMLDTEASKLAVAILEEIVDARNDGVITEDDDIDIDRFLTTLPTTQIDWDFFDIYEDLYEDINTYLCQKLIH